MRILVRLLAAGLLLALGACAALQWYATRPWPQWEAFARGFIQADGRVIDHTAGARSTSEGQAYALFFALVANDRKRFAEILRWTQDNLAGGDLSRNLPAWLWGQTDGSDGQWAVRDANPAADADLWLAYALLEAGRLWQRPDYAALGRAILRQVRAQEIVIVDGLGPILLPAPRGFELEGGGWRLNPSYWAEFQFRYFASVDPAGPWQDLIRTSRLLLEQATRQGVVPDWIALVPGQGVLPDPRSAGASSYDAIRVYLWAGMTPQSRWIDLLAPYAAIVRANGTPPESVGADGVAPRTRSPLGFSAAVLPFLAALNEDSLQQTQRARLQEHRGAKGALGDPAHYYDQVLALFGEGWADRRFRFGPNGRVNPRWSCTCTGG